MSEARKRHYEPFDMTAEREHLDWLKTLKASDMDGISAHNLVLRYARLFEQLEAVRRDCAELNKINAMLREDRDKAEEQLASAQEALRKIVKLGGQGYALSAADVARDALASSPASVPENEA